MPPSRKLRMYDTNTTPFKPLTASWLRLLVSPSVAATPAILTAVFSYWGWDTAVATNEEADDPASTPGRNMVARYPFL